MRTAADPFDRFAALYEEGVASGTAEPDAFVLATAGADGEPWTRALLLKGFDGRGFVFYTNLGSRKARQIAENPRVSLHFLRQIGGRNRQVVIQGRAEPVSPEEADAYFATRPRGSQLGAWASRQSEPLASRSELLVAVGRAAVRFPREIPRPPHWSGYRVVPRRFEFWDEGRFRLHDRTVFEREGEGWRMGRVYP